MEVRNQWSSAGVGSLLFVPYINDLDENVDNLASKFADYPQSGSEEGFLTLQQIVDLLER